MDHQCRIIALSLEIVQQDLECLRREGNRSKLVRHCDKGETERSVF
jgi:hypothetical protein